MDNKEIETLKQGFLNAFPNPGRVGCPDQQTLKAIAYERLPLSDPAYQHISGCSPCFKEVLEYQADWKRSRRHNRLLLALAAAAVIVIGLSVPFVTSHHTLESSALINFETTSQNRGIEEHTRPEAGIQMFQRKRLDLTVALPRGSNDGKYEFQVKRIDDLQVLVDTTGEAKIENGLTTFRASVDLSHLTPGTYLARVRRLPAGNWRDLPVQIK